VPGALARSNGSLTSHQLGMARISFAGETLDLHPEGVAIFPERRLMVVADLHLEKAASFAARGQMLPPYETLETLHRLARLVASIRPEQLVLLGDSFHSAVETIGEGGPARTLIEHLAATSEMIWIAGNHDPLPPLRLPGRWLEEIVLGGCVLRHVPVEDGRNEIVGHLHPAARIETRAGGQRRRCFAVSGKRLLMPAFGTLTGMVDLSDPGIRRLVPAQETRVFLMCRKGLAEVPASACLR